MENAIEITKENFEKEVMKSTEPVIVDFWAAWCGPCQLMAPVFEELAGEYKGKLKFAKLDTEAHPELSGQFGVQGIPTLIVLKYGKEIDRIVGFVQKPMLQGKIEDILKKL